MADSPTPARRFQLLLNTLRRLKPDGIVAIDAAGEESHVGIIGQRGRYERAARSLIAVGAVTARLLNKEGAVVEVITIENGEGADDAGLAASSTAKTANRSDEVRELVKIALDAADRARGRDLEMLSSVLEASTSVMKTAAERAERLEAMLVRMADRRERELAAAAAELHQLAAQNGNGEVDGKADELLEKLIGLATGKTPQ